MSAKIAPTVRWMIENEWARHETGVYADIRRETMALLAVARAAGSAKVSHTHVKGSGPVPGCPRCDLDRALARLSGERSGTR